MVGGYTPLNEMVPWTDLFVGQNGKIVRRGLRLKKTGREERDNCRAENMFILH
jgi:hypothetical protein